MVQGLNEFNKRWGAIPKAVRLAAQTALEKGATELVADMNQSKPIPEIQIGWTWGEAPKGAITLGSYGEPGQSLRITIYATATTEDHTTFPAVARWFEFGTSERRTKQGWYRGRIAAHPYFFPVYRAKKRRVKSRVIREINKAIKGI